MEFRYGDAEWKPAFFSCLFPILFYYYLIIHLLKKNRFSTTIIV